MPNTLARLLRRQNPESGSRSCHRVMKLLFVLSQVLEFQKGTLQNLYWKKFGCDSCSGKSVVCLNNQDCAIQTSQCKASGGPVDCNLGIQLAFSGTDKNDNVFNSWYEVANLRQYSLFALYSNLRNTLTGPFTNLL